MSNAYRFSCFVIGEGTLPIQCAEIILQRGHLIHGIISPEDALRKWALAKNIRAIDPLHDPQLLSYITAQPFDYLFSIVNYSVLPEVMEILPWWMSVADSNQSPNSFQSLYDEMIRAPRRAAINYHDAPLPRYAGFYTTSWALMNQETIHGVTWHRMTGQIDAGDILAQSQVNISPGETAWTLNAKCYEAAIRSFGSLIQNLERHQETTSTQDMRQRTYFPLHRHPPAGGILSWNNSAEALDALVRSLSFGSHPNPLGSPKLLVAGKLLLISELNILPDASTLNTAKEAPGTILAITPQALTIAARTSAIGLRRLATIDGQERSIQEIVEQFALHEGYRLQNIDPVQASRIEDVYTRLSPHEKFWVDRFINLNPASLPYTRDIESRMPYAGNQQTAQIPANEIPAISAPIVSSFSATIPNDILRYLKEHQPDYGQTDFLSAAFAIYISRLTGGANFDIGLRTASALEMISGLEHFFASYVPLQISIHLEWHFSQTLAAVKAQLAQLEIRGSYARDLLVRYPVLEAARQIFEHPSKYSITWPIALDTGGCGFTPGNHASAPHPILTLSLPADGRHDKYQWVYDTRYLSPQIIQQIQNQFDALLHSLCTFEDTVPVKALNLLGQVERFQLLEKWNTTQVVFPQDRCLHHLYETQAEKTPDAIAVIFDAPVSGTATASNSSTSRRLTYRELNAHANRLAHYLMQLGTGPDTIVGVCMERSLEMVISLLGILKAGGAYLPLDPTYPQERLSWMLADSCAPVLLTQGHLLDALPSYAGQIIPINLSGQVVHGDHSIVQPAENPRSPVNADNLAYVLYTSGSTGLPKGAMIPHRAICNHMYWMQAEFSLDESDAVLQKTPFSFDASVWEFYAPLLSGGRLIMARPGGHVDSDYLVKAINTHQITTLQLVPTLLHMLLQNPSFASCTSLKRVFCGGEPLPPDYIQRFFETLPANLYNLYGPTEVTIDSIYWPCVRPDIRPGITPGTHQHENAAEAASRIGSTYIASTIVPIGRPVPNIEAYILDKFLQPVPVGVAGQLYLGGAGVGRGYLNRPSLTAERFIPNPFSSTGSRLYQTGDLARYLPDGDIEYLGRVDFQVKIRGHRIEPGEIETVIQELPTIEKAIVIARDDLPGGNRLVAYLLPASGMGSLPSAGDLRNHVASKMPDYMVPSVFTYLDVLPLLPNGKVDRHALPAPPTDRPELRAKFTTPDSAAEQLIAGVWEQILGISPVGSHDNFFDLGGNSLLATQMIYQLQNIFQVKIPLDHFFRAATVSQSATLIEELLIEEIEKLDEEQTKALLG